MLSEGQAHYLLEEVSAFFRRASTKLEVAMDEEGKQRLQVTLKVAKRVTLWNRHQEFRLRDIVSKIQITSEFVDADDRSFAR